MTYHDSLILFGLFLVFLGFGLLIYCQLLSLFARIHTRLFPPISLPWVRRTRAG